MKRFRLFTIACTAALLGAAPNTTLPTVLQPHVYPGETFRYELNRTVVSDRRFGAVSGDTSYTDVVSSASPAAIAWTRIQSVTHSNASIFQFSVDTSGTVTNSSGHPAPIRSFLYNSALFGKPPASLTIGTRWSNMVIGQNSTDLWNVTVAEIQPARELVRLHLLLESRGVRLPLGDLWREGDVVFEHGIMTRLLMRGNDTFFDRSVTPPMIPTNLAFDYGAPDSVGYPQGMVSLPYSVGYFEAITLLTTP